MCLRVKLGHKSATHTITALWLVPAMLGRVVVKEDDCFSAMICRGIESSSESLHFFIVQKCDLKCNFGIEKCDMEVIWKES